MNYHIHTHYSDGFLTEDEASRYGVICDHDTIIASVLTKTPVTCELKTNEGNLVVYAFNQKNYDDICTLLKMPTLTTRDIALRLPFSPTPNHRLYQAVREIDLEELKRYENIVIEIYPAVTPGWQELKAIYKERGFKVVLASNYHGEPNQLTLLYKHKPASAGLSMAQAVEKSTFKLMNDDEEFLANFSPINYSFTPPTIPQSWVEAVWELCQTETQRREFEMLANANLIGVIAFCYRFIHEARKQGVEVKLRGSARASTLLSSFLGLETEGLGLIFERFWNPYRSDPPDVDFEVSDRDKALSVLRDTAKLVSAEVYPLAAYVRYTEPPELKGRIRNISISAAGTVVASGRVPTIRGREICSADANAWLVHAYPFKIDIINVDNYAPPIRLRKKLRIVTTASVPHYHTYVPGLTLWGIQELKGFIDLEDLIVVAALIRPGCKAIAREYLEKHYGHHRLFELIYPKSQLRASYLPLFQEEVMLKVKEITGDWKLAELARKVLAGKAQPTEELAEILRKLQMPRNVGYLFNRAHALACAESAMFVFSLSRDELAGRIANYLLNNLRADEILHCLAGMVVLGYKVIEGKETKLNMADKVFILGPKFFPTPPLFPVGFLELLPKLQEQFGGILTWVRLGDNHNAVVVTPLGVIPHRALPTLPIKQMPKFVEIT